jgi:hypothetical protein
MILSFVLEVFKLLVVGNKIIIKRISIKKANRFTLEGDFFIVMLSEFEGFLHVMLSETKHL